MCLVPHNLSTKSSSQRPMEKDTTEELVLPPRQPQHLTPHQRTTAPYVERGRGGGISTPAVSAPEPLHQRKVDLRGGGLVSAAR